MSNWQVWVAQVTLTSKSQGRQVVANVLLCRDYINSAYPRALVVCCQVAAVLCPLLGVSSTTFYKKLNKVPRGKVEIHKNTALINQLKVFGALGPQVTHSLRMLSWNLTLMLRDVYVLHTP